MARRHRIHFPGAVYHVIARGNNRENVFINDDDKAHYLKLIEKYKQKYPFSLYAYVLMDNHLHLLLAIQDQPLSKIMQGIQQSYTQYFNKQHSHVGHVFQQRYKALLCKNDSYLLMLLRYIHMNPVKASLPGGINYFWSSHKFYLTSINSIVDTEYILSMLSSNKQNALSQYQEMIGRGDVTAEELAEGYVINVCEPTITPTEESGGCMTINEILEAVAIETDINANRILTEKGTRVVVRARNLVIYAAVVQNVMTKTEIANFLNLSLPRVIKGYNSVLEDGQARGMAETIIQGVKRKKRKA